MEVNSKKDRDTTLAVSEAQDETLVSAPEIPLTEYETSSPDRIANQVYAKYANIVADRATQYAISSGTLLKTDETDARRACDQIVYRVVDDLLLEPGKRDAGEHYALYKQYMGNPEFKARLENYIFIKAYLEQKNAGKDTPEDKPSVMKQIRDAQKAPKPPAKPKPELGRKKDGPEL